MELSLYIKHEDVDLLKSTELFLNDLLRNLDIAGVKYEPTYEHHTVNKRVIHFTVWTKSAEDTMKLNSFIPSVVSFIEDNENALKQSDKFTCGYFTRKFLYVGINLS